MNYFQYLWGYMNSNLLKIDSLKHYLLVYLSALQNVLLHTINGF